MNLRAAPIGSKRTNIARPVAPSDTQIPRTDPRLPAPNNTDGITSSTNCEVAVAENTEGPQSTGKEETTAIGRADSVSITGSLEEYLAVETYFRCTAVQSGLPRGAHRNPTVKKLRGVIAGHIPTATGALRHDSTGRNFKSLEIMMSATNTLAALTEKLEYLDIGSEVKNDLAGDLRNLSQALIELFGMEKEGAGERERGGVGGG